MYRPTVRYSDVYKTYVDGVFHATTLDRNQIIRAALFVAGHSGEFHNLLKTYLKDDVLPPSPSWCMDDTQLWMEQNPKHKRGGRDVNANSTRAGKDEKINGVVRSGGNPRVIKEKETHSIRRLKQDEGRTGKVFSGTSSNGGITIKIG